MPGRACPLCRGPALPFGRYWREFDNPHFVMRCSRCGSELTVHPAGLIVAIASGMVAWMPVMLPVLLWGARQATLGRAEAIVVPAFMAGMAAGMFTGMFLAWRLVPWRVVATAKKPTDDYRDWMV